MILFISDDFFHYEAGNLVRLFFPYDELKVALIGEEVNSDDNNIIVAEIHGDNYICSIERNGKNLTKKELSLTTVTRNIT